MRSESQPSRSAPGPNAGRVLVALGIAACATPLLAVLAVCAVVSEARARCRR